jgi:hypothetical protein
MQNLPKDAPAAETVSLWFADDHNLTMSPTGRAIVRFSMPGLPVGRRLNPPYEPNNGRPRRATSPPGCDGGAAVTRRLR